MTQNILLKNELINIGYTKTSRGMYVQEFATSNDEVVENTIYINYVVPDIIEVNDLNDDVTSERIKLKVMYNFFKQ